MQQIYRRKPIPKCDFNEVVKRSPTGINFNSFSIFNDLYNVSNILQPIMFAGDTNLFSSHSNINDPFNNVNLELNKTAICFKTNKLSLNEGKTKYIFFHKFKTTLN